MEKGGHAGIFQRIAGSDLKNCFELSTAFNDQGEDLGLFLVAYTFS